MQALIKKKREEQLSFGMKTDLSRNDNSIQLRTNSMSIQNRITKNNIPKIAGLDICKSLTNSNQLQPNSSANPDTNKNPENEFKLDPIEVIAKFLTSVLK